MIHTRFGFEFDEENPEDQPTILEIY